MKKLMLFALSSAMLFSSCEPSKVTPEPEVPESGDYTFSALGAKFATGDQIAVTAYSDAAFSTKVAENVQYTFNGTVFESKTPIEFTEDVKLAFSAVSPYSKDAVTSFEVAEDQSAEGYAKSDLVTAKLPQTAEAKPSLNFAHALGQIIVSFEGIDAVPTINAVAGVECDVLKPSFTASGEVAAITPAENGENTYKAIVAPQTFAKDAVVAVVSIEGVEYQVLAAEEIALASGKSYTFNGRVNEEGALEFLGTSNAWDVVGKGLDKPTEPDEPDEPEDPTATELIIGGDFENGASSQVTNNYSASTAEATTDGDRKVWMVSNSEARDQDYLAQFAFFLNTGLAPGDKLDVSFEVRSDNSSDVTGLGMGISVAPYHIETVVLPDGGSTIHTTTEWQKVEYSLDITEANYVTEKLTFSIGTTADNFYLDNVSVKLTSAGGVIPDDGNEPVDPNVAGVDFVKNMGVGWNLGNALDAVGGETAWGNPKTTKDMIDKVAKKGFKTLRVPITWHTHVSSNGEYTVAPAWMNRVEEIVNYGLDNDMYVIINIHHDEEIIVPSYAELDESKKVVGALWTQIADRFKDYSDKLIFESLNEMRVKGSPNEWNGGDDEGRDCLNQLHAVSLDAIRNSGGNNATRKVMLSPYAASNNANAMAGLEIPENDENIIVSIHSYAPYDFCMNESSTDKDWGTDADKVSLDKMFWEIYDLFIAKGIPVIMGEWGSMTKNPEAARATHAEYYAQAARDHFICPVVWDDGGNFQIFDRNALTWKYESMADAIVKAQ